MQDTQLTERQHEFLQYLTREISNTGVPPSLRKAAADFGISHTAVASLLNSLQAKGWIRREGKYSRTITLLPRDKMPSPGSPVVRNLPVIGQVAAGLPLYAQQEWAGFVAVDATVYRGENLFCLRVQGDSMIDAAILDNDLAICEPRQFARNGEIVVALINNEEATVKRFYYQGDHIELKPENRNYPVMRYELGEVLVQGKVIGIQRGPEQMDRHAHFTDPPGMDRI